MWDLGLPAVLVVSSVMMAVYGIATGVPLFMAFPIIGLVNGGSSLRYWLRAPSHPMHWWFAHMSAMLGASIAAVTAFLAVNAGNVGLPTTSLVVWLGPTLIGSPTIAIWTAYYRRKFRTLEPRRSQKPISHEGHEAHEASS